MVSNSQLCVFLSLFLINISSFANAVGSSSTYYFKYFATKDISGYTTVIFPWYKDDNSWGVDASEGQGFVAMVTGEDWGTTSPVAVLPKKLKDVNRSHTTWFSQIASPLPGAGYDATYSLPLDIPSVLAAL
jgi:hypothetical protein